MSVRLLRKARLTYTLRSVHLCRGYSVASSSKTARKAEVHAGSSHELAQVDRGTEDPAESGPAEETQSTPKHKSSPKTVSNHSKTFQPKVAHFLASLQASSHQPTIADLERHRPRTRPPPESPNYATEYTNLVNLLCRTFSKQQIQALLDQSLSIAGKWRRSSPKIDLAETIIEKLWGWTSLKELERAKRDRTEVVQKSFNVTPSQLFLILGKNGSDLLQLSKTYNVHIALDRQPLALQFEGLRGDMKKVSERINSVKRDITEEIFELPTKAPIRKDMLQRISRLVGAYVENVGFGGKVKICARSSRGLATAKRLVIRAAQEFSEDVQASVLAYVPANTSTLSESDKYALYPFMSPRSLPWFMGTEGAFRYRHIGQTMGRPNGEDLEKTCGLTSDNALIVSPDEQRVDLRKVLLDALPVPLMDTSQHKRVVKISTGHVLVNTSVKEQKLRLPPDLQGTHSFSEMIQYVSDQSAKTSFVSSLPPQLIDLTSPNQRFLHRLTYYVWQGHGDHSSKNPPLVRRKKVLSFEVVVSDPTQSSSSESVSEIDSVEKLDEAIARDVPLLNSHVTPVRCWSGVEAEVDVMLPSRPMDMQVVMLDYHDIPMDKQPPELVSYLSDLRDFLANVERHAERPDPPFYITIGSDTYTLQSSSSVRQNTGLIDANAVDQSSTIKVVGEGIIDLESEQKTTRCEVTCEDFTNEKSWKQFLSQCDSLTATPYKSTATESTLVNNDNMQF